MRKRSVRIRGHATSVSLENLFWEELQSIADRRNIAIRTLIEEIDEEREIPNLSSAIRLAVVTDLRTRAGYQQTPAH